MTTVPDSITSSERAVIIDQVGYLPNAEKRAIVTADANRFELRTTDGETVFDGPLSDPIDDPDAGETVRHAVFSAVTEPGEYHVVTDDGSRSHPFTIDKSVYDDVLASVGRLYTLKRSNTPIDDPVTGVQTEGGHGQDAQAQLYFADEFHDEGDRIDVAGGWYDAGDYGKYVPPGAIAVAHQLLAYELAPAAFAPGDYEMPPGVRNADEALPDVLAEARFELEWLETMQRPDGSVYHKVGGAEWPSLLTRPSADTQPRYVYGHSTFGTAMYAATMAMAARVYRPFDPAFADQCLDNARAAQAYLEANLDAHFRFDPGQDAGSGPYRKKTDGEERFWAAAELLRTTGDDQYATYIEDDLAAYVTADPTPPTWRDGLTFGQWAYLQSDAGDENRKAILREGFLASAESLCDRLDERGYRIALDSDEYVWSSSKGALAKGVLAVLANEIDPDDRYVAAATDQLHYVLGRSPTGYSYVTGHGERSVENPHDRMVESTGTLLSGMLVSGANRKGGDDLLEAYIDEHTPPPAKSFIDHEWAYSATEWAVDYTAPLVVVLAHAVARGTGDE